MTGKTAIIVFFLFVVPTLDVFAVSVRLKRKCSLRITYVLKIGKTRQETLLIKARDSADCGKRSQAFRENFDPGNVSQKNVEWKWLAVK